MSLAVLLHFIVDHLELKDGFEPGLVHKAIDEALAPPEEPPAEEETV